VGKKLKSLNGYAQKYRKTVHRAVESVLKKKKNTTVGKERLLFKVLTILTIFNVFVIKALVQM